MDKQKTEWCGTIAKRGRGKTVFYSDQFFIGDVTDPGMFVAGITKENDPYQPKELDIEFGYIQNGISLHFDLDNEDDRAEALKTISKITEGFQNLLSALKRECDESR